MLGHRFTPTKKVLDGIATRNPVIPRLCVSWPALGFTRQCHIASYVGLGKIVREIYLQPGDLYFGSGEIQLITLLGSCVSVLLWHEQRRLGGMCHVMLPTRAAIKAGQLEGRYADEAIALLRQAIHTAKTFPDEYQVMLFGGGNMFPTSTSIQVNVGERNIRAARSLLQTHGFALTRSEVGGVGYRRLRFDLATGRVGCTLVTEQQVYAFANEDYDG